MFNPIEIYVWHTSKDDSYELINVEVKMKDVSEKERIEKLVEEHKILDLPIDSAPGVALIKRIAEMLKVDFSNIDLYINYCLFNDYYDEIIALGFSKEDIDDIWHHFSYTLSMADWKSILLFENDEEMFKYVYIEDNDDKESLIEIIFEMGKVSKEVLIEGESVINHMIEVGTDEELTMKLSSGKWVVFTEELLHKEVLEAMD